MTILVQNLAVQQAANDKNASVPSDQRLSFISSDQKQELGTMFNILEWVDVQ